MFESEFECNLFALRQDKLRQISELGQQTYPNQFVTSHTLAEVRRQFDDIPPEVLDAQRTMVTVAGRIMAIRAQGKAGFAQLQQGGERLQIYVRLDAVGEQGFQLYKLLDLGDHIGVSGYVFRTRTGELTIHVEKITFLAKAMLALPEKYHGLADVELRYRQRYVDLFMNTDVRAVFVKRAQVLKAIRSFFDQRGYIEVETPMMQPIAGGAAARPFRTHHNALDLPLYLRIAPELYLKRLVVGGLDRVYEINRNFRNEGVSTQHNPEFTMLEFYQAYANYHDLMQLTQELIMQVATGGERHHGDQFRRPRNRSVTVAALLHARGHPRVLAGGRGSQAVARRLFKRSLPWSRWRTEYERPESLSSTSPVNRRERRSPASSKRWPRTTSFSPPSSTTSPLRFPRFPKTSRTNRIGWSGLSFIWGVRAGECL